MYLKFNFFFSLNFWQFLSCWRFLISYFYIYPHSNSNRAKNKWNIVPKYSCYSDLKYCASCFQTYLNIYERWIYVLLNHCLSKGHHRINITFKVIFFVFLFTCSIFLISNFTLCVRFVFLIGIPIASLQFLIGVDFIHIKTWAYRYISINIQFNQFFSFVWLKKKKKTKLSLKSSFLRNK